MIQQIVTLSTLPIESHCSLSNPYSYLHNTISSCSQSHCQKENTLHTIDTNSFHFLYTHCQIHISYNYQKQMGWLWTSPLQLIKEICYTYSIHIERFPSHSTHHKPMKPHYRHTIHNYIPLNTLRIIPIPSISHTLITQQHQIPFQTYPHRYLSNSMERISDRITPYHTIHKSPLILLLTTSHSSYYTLSPLPFYTIHPFLYHHPSNHHPHTPHHTQPIHNTLTSIISLITTITILLLFYHSHTPSTHISSHHHTLFSIYSTFIHSYYLPLINYPFHHSHTNTHTILHTTSLHSLTPSNTFHSILTHILHITLPLQPHHSIHTTTNHHSTH